MLTRVLIPYLDTKVRYASVCSGQTGELSWASGTYCGHQVPADPPEPRDCFNKEAAACLPACLLTALGELHGVHGPGPPVHGDPQGLRWAQQSCSLLRPCHGLWGPGRAKGAAALSWVLLRLPSLPTLLPHAFNCLQGI